MSGNGNHMRRLRRARAPAFVALYALLIEIFFGAMHAAALAASAFGPPADPDSFLFQICTPSGLTSIRVTDEKGERPAPSSSRGQASDFCPVCGSTAVSLFTFALPASVPPVAHAVFSQLLPQDRTHRSLTAWRGVRIRAPPA